MNDRPTCQTCRWWDPPTHGNALAGTCRRNPPVFTTVRRAIWPGSASDDWCGEHAEPTRARTDAKRKEAT